MTGKYDYYLAEGGKALKACKAYDALVRERWQARSKLAEDQGATAAVKIGDQWGFIIEGQPGPGWKRTAQSGLISSYLPDLDTPEGRAYRDQLENLSPPGPAEMAGLLDLDFEDPHQPMALQTPGLGLVIRLVRQPKDFMICPLPAAVRQLEEAEFFVGRLRKQRKAG